MPYNWKYYSFYPNNFGASALLQMEASAMLLLEREHYMKVKYVKSHTFRINTETIQYENINIFSDIHN